MLIRSSVATRNTTNYMKSTQIKKTKSMEKLSSGLRVNRAADDAASLAISETMRGQIRGLQQASRNIQDGISLIQTGEGAMQEIHNMLHRMNELAVQASNGTYSDSDREQMQFEFLHLKNEIDSISENTTFNKLKLLNGEHSSSAYGSYTQIAGSRVLSGTLTVNHTNNILNLGLDTGDYTITMSNGSYTPAQLVDHINEQFLNGNIDVKASLEGGKLSFSPILQGEYPIYSITGNGVSFLLDGKDGVPGQYVVAGEALLTPFITITAGVNDTLSFEVDGIGYSIVLQEGTYMTPRSANADTSPLAMEINAKLNALNIPIIAGYGGFSGTHPTLPGDVYSACLTFKGNVGSISNFGGSARDTLLGALWVDRSQGGSPSTVIGAADLSNGLEIVSGMNDELQIQLNGNLYTYVFGAGDYSAEKLVEELNNHFTGEQIIASISNGRMLLNSLNGSPIRITGGSLSKDLFLVYKEGESPDNERKGIYIQTGDKTGEGILLNMPDVRASSLELLNLDIASVSSAVSSITSIQKAVQNVSHYRAMMGGYQNRLDYILNNVQVYTENLASSESKLRDTDVAKVMVELSKHNILEQSGQLLLAQSTAISQNTLKLFQ